ncbi:MAG TPA: hypothetical protein DDW52_22870, partial [Planctomycetaceae bacterium]|nr:hypothetical protein [Planctomycetaceae bacterium]
MNSTQSTANTQITVETNESSAEPAENAEPIKNTAEAIENTVGSTKNTVEAAEISEQVALQAEPQSRAGERSLHLTVAYDGAQYFGWQKQPDQLTVQEVLERGLSIATGQKNVRTLASSRTDTGVHAIAQSVLFKSTHWPAPAERLPYAVNTSLPPDIVVRKCEEVSPYFHPLRDSTGKRYRYLIYNARKEDPLGRAQHWWVRRRLDLEQMQIAAAFIEGEHDFNSFQSTGSPRSSTIRIVRELAIH